MKSVKHIFAVMMAVLLMLGNLGGQAFADLSDTVEYQSKTEHSGSDTNDVAVFTVKSSGKTFEGTCAQFGVENLKSGTAKTRKISNDSRHAKIVFHYGIEKGWWRGSHADDSAKNIPGMSSSSLITYRLLFKYLNQISIQGKSEWKEAALSQGISSQYVNSVCDYYDNADVSDVSVPDSFEMYFCDAGKGQNFTVWRYEPNGYAYIKKTASNTSTDFLTEAPNNYSLAGAVFQLYSDSGCTVAAKDASGSNAALTTDSSGKTGVICMEAGTYYVKETRAPKGYMISGAVLRADISSDNTEKDPYEIRVEDVPTYGKLFSLKKTDKTGRNGWKKLIGAEYTLSYYDVSPETKDVSGLKAKRSWVFKTVKKLDGNEEAFAGIDFDKDDPLEGSDPFYNENGMRIMPCGVFTIEETKAPSGLTRNTKVYYGKVYQPSNGATAKTEVGFEEDGDLRVDKGNEDGVVNDEHPQGVRIVIDKRNASTHEKKALESEAEHSSGRKGRFSDLSGAVYEVYYDDNDEASPQLVGTITTDASGNGELTKRTTGDERFVGDDLPVGEYLIKEVTPAPGYATDEFEFDKDKSIQKKRGDEEISVICTYEENGVKVTKSVKGSFKGGYYSFRTRAESINTEQFTYTILSYDEPLRTYVSKTDSKSGKAVPGAELQIISLNEEDEGSVIEEWTSSSDKKLIWELQPGRYLLREIKAPYGYDIAEDVEFEVDGKDIVTNVEMKNVPIEIGTTAQDEETGTHHGSFKNDEIIKDVVAVSGLQPGRTYKLSGCVVDKSTGKILLDKDGNEIISESEEFTACGDTASVEMGFTVDSSSFTEDSAVVVFEKLYRTSSVRDEELPVELAKHEDINDESQGIRYGGIAGTIATDKKDGDHKLKTKKKAVVIDTIEYKNLSPKETYYVQGALYDKTSGELTDIVGSTEFVPKKANGTTQVVFSFDARELDGHSLVAFEYVFANGNLVSKHDDADNEDQTVSFIAPHFSPDTGDRELLSLFAWMGILAVAMLAAAMYIRKRHN